MSLVVDCKDDVVFEVVVLSVDRSHWCISQSDTLVLKWNSVENNVVLWGASMSNPAAWDGATGSDRQLLRIRGLSGRLRELWNVFRFGVIEHA